jgi:MinD-like ATPase involved in chromosome partitioning or flagellar assembly
MTTFFHSSFVIRHSSFPPMPDQADQLRQLATSAPAPVGHAAGGLPLIVVTGARAGAGATTVAVNVGAALVDAGLRVLLVDASPSQSIATENSPTRSDKPEPLALKRGPAETMLLATGPVSNSDGGDWRRQQQQLLAKIQSLGGIADVAVVDAGNGVTPWTRRFWRHALLVLVATTTEDSAVMDCYATIKLALTDAADAEMRLLVNQCERPATAIDVHKRLSIACERFLGRQLAAAPALPRHASGDCRHGRPRVWEMPNSTFGHAVLWLGRSVIDVLASAQPSSLAAQRRCNFAK